MVPEFVSCAPLRATALATTLAPELTVRAPVEPLLIDTEEPAPVAVTVELGPMTTLPPLCDTFTLLTAETLPRFNVPELTEMLAELPAVALTVPVIEPSATVTAPVPPLKTTPPVPLSEPEPLRLSPAGLEKVN